MQRSRRPYCFGFTLIEMLVVVSIIAILAALLMPTLQRSIATARQISCANKLKQWGVELYVYSEGNNGYMPAPCANVGGTWYEWYKQMKINATSSYIDPLHICPTAEGLYKLKPYRTYGCATGGNDPKLSFKTDSIKSPSRSFYMFDAAEAAGYPGWGESTVMYKADISRIDFRHNGGADLLFLDTHVALLNYVEVSNDISWTYP